MQPEKIKKDWKARGFSFGVWEDPPGQVWKDYVHQVDELFLVAEGEVTVKINGNVRVAKIR